MAFCEANDLLMDRDGEYASEFRAALRCAVIEFAEHYHTERNRQGLGNRLIDPAENVGQTGGEIVRHNRLGGLLKYYERKAA